MNSIKFSACPLCDGTALEPLWQKDNVYSSVGILSKTKNELVSRSNIDLVQCISCGFAFNRAFDEDKIQRNYKSSEYVLKKIVSPKMGENLRNVRDNLLKIIGKDSIYMEIGAGDGALARGMAESVRHVYTVDPSCESANLEGVKNLTHINDFFSTRIFSQIPESPDLIVLRHLLEHISNPFEFLQCISEHLREGAFLYVEIPNMAEIVEHQRFYDIFHDHFGYFSKECLVNTLMSLGMRLKEEVYMFNGQHMGFTFIKETALKVDKLAIHKYRWGGVQLINRLSEKLSLYRSVAIYGAGAHGNSMYDYLENKKNIDICFDSDPAKVGKYLQGTDIEIKKPTPKDLNAVDMILMASALYEDEICDMLYDNGFDGDIIRTASCTNL